MNRRNVIAGIGVTGMLVACTKGKQSMPNITTVETNFGFEVIKTSGKTAMGVLHSLSNSPNITPVILGKPENLLYISEGIEFSEEENASETLQKAKVLDFPNGFKDYQRKKYLEVIEDMGENPEILNIMGMTKDELDVEPSEEINIEELIAEWTPDLPHVKQRKNPLKILDWETDKPLKEVLIAKLPTSDWTEAPAYLKFGGYNDCPESEWHIAALRYWRDKYGAELISMTHAVIELKVSRKPKTKKEALRLALEYYEYCPDIVDQGSGDIFELAHKLMYSDMWYFWWD